MRAGMFFWALEGRHFDTNPVQTFEGSHFEFGFGFGFKNQVFGANVSHQIPSP